MPTYKRDDKDFKATLAKIADSPLLSTQVAGRFHKAANSIKPFPKHEDKIVTATIDENGDVLFLATHANDALFLNQGSVVTKRASHVEPASRDLRFLFHFLRLFGDKTKIADWTRNWNCLWRVNTKPVGGPILRWKHVFPGILPCLKTQNAEWVYVWRDRQQAIDAEVKFLNTWFLERGIK